MYNTLYRTCIYHRVPGFQTCKKKIKNQSINLEKVHFVGLCCLITMRSTKKRTIRRPMSYSELFGPSPQPSF